jgi:hypothetical protein
MSLTLFRKISRRLAPLALLALASPVAQAAEPQAIDFVLSPLVIGTRTYDRLLVDIRQGGRFIQANGVVMNAATGTASPVNGTCFTNVNSGAYCSMQFGTRSLILVVDAALNGSYELKDATDTVLANGTMTRIVAK